MRKIQPQQIAVFATLVTFAVLLAVITTWLAFGRIPFGDFRGVVLTLVGIILFYVYSIVLYRVFFGFFPLRDGEVGHGTAQEFIYHVYVLFYLMIFYPIMRSGFMPAPFMRAFYLALGAKLGVNTYSQGIIHDPGFVTIGDHSVVGQSALLIPHVIEGDKLAHYPIRIGNHVTVGAMSAVLPGVTIGDGATVATGAVVPKGTVIGAGEIWGGVPAKRIK